MCNLCDNTLVSAHLGIFSVLKKTPDEPFYTTCEHCVNQKLKFNYGIDVSGGRVDMSRVFAENGDSNGLLIHRDWIHPVIPTKVGPEFSHVMEIMLSIMRHDMKNNKGVIPQPEDDPLSTPALSTTKNHFNVNSWMVFYSELRSVVNNARYGAKPPVEYVRFALDNKFINSVVLDIRNRKVEDNRENVFNAINAAISIDESMDTIQDVLDCLLTNNNLANATLRICPICNGNAEPIFPMAPHTTLACVNCMIVSPF